MKPAPDKPRDRSVTQATDVHRPRRETPRELFMIFRNCDTS
jgi:hypothetical protein